MEGSTSNSSAVCTISMDGKMSRVRPLTRAYTLVGMVWVHLCLSPYIVAYRFQDQEQRWRTRYFSIVKTPIDKTYGQDAGTITNTS